MPLPEPTYSVKQACQAAGVTRRTIYNWLKAGKLQYKRTAGGSIRIYPDSLWRTTKGEEGNHERVAPD